MDFLQIQPPEKDLWPVNAFIRTNTKHYRNVMSRMHETGILPHKKILFTQWQISYAKNCDTLVRSLSLIYIHTHTHTPTAQRRMPKYCCRRWKGMCPMLHPANHLPKHPSSYDTPIKVIHFKNVTITCHLSEWGLIMCWQFKDLWIHTHWKTLPAIHFTYFINKENYRVIETCCTNFIFHKMPFVA